MLDITARTRVAAVIGWPIEHSLSPVIHNAGFRSTGVDAVYVAFPVPPGGASDALRAMRHLNLLGLSVTMPHKADMAELVDEVTPSARVLDSVNTVEFRDGVTTGHSTDGDGFIASLREYGQEVSGRSVTVIGAGAAARAVVDALARYGAATVTVVNRTLAAAEAAASLGPHGSRAFDLVDRELVDTAVSSSDIVVNCTSVGMGAVASTGETPIDTSVLTPRQVVVDLVYHPVTTPLLRAAADAGCKAVNGLGMLVHQAALQQQIWTGHVPDVADMTAAVRLALG